MSLKNKKLLKKSIIIILIICIISASILLYFLIFKKDIVGPDRDDSSDDDEPNTDIFIVKYDNDGNLIWKTTFIMTSIDEGHDIVTDKDNNIIVVGEINAGIGILQDVVLIKLTSTGNELWDTTWGGSGHECGNGVVTDNESNIYITGTTDGYGSGKNDAFIVKFNSTGTQLWNITWGGIYGDYANDIILDNETNIYITGRTKRENDGDFDIFIAKFNGTNGNQIWNTTWGGTDYETGYELAYDNKTNNNIYLVGYTNSFGAGQADVVIAKYYLNGTKIWNYTWGYSSYDVGYSITINSSNNFYITGYTQYSSTASMDVFLIKYDSDGTQLWNTTWDGSGDVLGKSIVIDNEDNLYITGYTYSHYFILKYDSSGNQKWVCDPGAFNFNRANGITIDNSNSIYITGMT